MSLTATADTAVISESTVDISAAVTAAMISPKMPGRLISSVATKKARLACVSTGRIPACTRALATQPELLLIDEMMAGLNHTEIAEAMDLIQRIRTRGVTIVMIEHVMKAIMNVCNRIIVLHHGKKIAEGTPTEIVNSPTVIEVYLGETSDAGG